MPVNQTAGLLRMMVPATGNDILRCTNVLTLPRGADFNELNANINSQQAINTIAYVKAWILTLAAKAVRKVSFNCQK